jgi:plastocyanin
MRLRVLAQATALAAIATSGCGGGESSSPTAPTVTPVTVNIVGSAGNQAFSPNPVQAPPGASIVFRNNTSDFHRLVMDSGTLIGDLSPGASSAPMQLGAGGNYHCTTHPSMVGSINGATAPTPPPGSGDGY